MKRHRIDRHKSRSIFAIGFVSVAVVGLSLHGCVRSPQEFLAGLRGQRSENPGMVPPSESGRGQQLAEGADPWAHSASETAIQQVDYQTESNAAIDNTKAATPNGPGEENRLASILQQRRQEQNQRIAAEPRPAAPNHSRDFVPTAATPQLPRNSAAAG